jgi:ATP-binding cassette subfamily B multidrug efflux pump
MSAKENRPRRVFRGGPGGGGPAGALARPAEKAKDFKGTVRRLAQYLRPQLPKLAVVVCFAIASTVFTVKAPKIMGDATNQLTDGFIAKSTVNAVSQIQSKMVPSIKKMLDQLDQGERKALDQADAMVEKKFNEGVAAKKQEAYAQAEQKADTIAEQKFNEAIQTKKQQAYLQAQQKADALAEQKFNEAVDQQKQQAYTLAVQQADAQFAGIPETPQLEQLKQQAEEQAKAAVDAQFAARQPEMQKQLAAAKQQAETQAKSAVDAELAKQQTTMQSQLASVKQQAEAQARAAVDAAFKEQEPEMQAQLAKLKSQTEAKVRKQVNETVLKKGKMTAAQLDTLRQIAALPNIKTIKDKDQMADTVQKLFSLTQKLPAEYTKKMPAVSKANMNKGISDVRKYGGSIPLKAIGHTLLWMLTVYGLSALCLFIMQFTMSDVAQKIVFVLRREVDEKLTRLPLRYFDSHPHGDVLSRMTNDIDTVSATLQQSLTQLITSSLQIVGYVWMMFTIHWLLTLIVLATLPLYILTTVIIARHSQRFYAAQQKHLGSLSGHTEEMFTGHVIVKAFGHEQESIETFRGINDDLYDAGWKAQFMSGIMMPVMNFIGNLGYVLIAVVGGIFVTRSYLGLGDIVAFISYSKSFSMPIIQTANIANIIQSTVACAERVFEMLDEEEEQPDVSAAVTIDQPQGNIRFEHVQFSYKESEPLMQDMALDIKQGETIAIVGPTGAGKTTLVNLLMRFYEIQGGAITFDGQDIRRMRRGDLRTLFGMVLQDTWLFNGSIRDNIAYGRQGATEEEIVAAAKAARADHFIRSLPEGYDTVLNEEASNISQGQKQLLTIARAILADPAVLILDEATSNVDTRTEVLIQKAMGVLMKGRTNFVIAHRLSTIRDAHMILVMNHGTIVEKGNHQELLAKKGFYAELYNSQFTGASLSA